ncbi:MAG: hypothetical protein ACTSWL_07665 [Promethearchaeota archaeon]
MKELFIRSGTSRKDILQHFKIDEKSEKKQGIHHILAACVYERRYGKCRIEIFPTLIKEPITDKYLFIPRTLIIFRGQDEEVDIAIGLFRRKFMTAGG